MTDSMPQSMTPTKMVAWLCTLANAAEAETGTASLVFCDVCEIAAMISRQYFEIIEARAELGRAILKRDEWRALVLDHESSIAELKESSENQKRNIRKGRAELDAHETVPVGSVVDVLIGATNEETIRRVTIFRVIGSGRYRVKLGPLTDGHYANLRLWSNGCGCLWCLARGYDLAVIDWGVVS